MAIMKGIVSMNFTFYWKDLCQFVPTYSNTIRKNVEITVLTDRFAESVYG